VDKFRRENSRKNNNEWLADARKSEWDGYLAQLGGHPLQSALWGNARHHVDGIADQRWVLTQDGRVTALLRVEHRRVPGLGFVAWAPRGPAGNLAESEFGRILNDLKASGCVLVVLQPNSGAGFNGVRQCEGAYRTIWLNLTRSEDELWRNLDKQWRYGVRRAAREGVISGTTHSDDDIETFFRLCMQVGRLKGFDMPGSLPLMKYLLKEGGPGVNAQLFVAKLNGEVKAGAFIMRCGTSLHYFWGAVDRTSPKLRAGEAVHWAVIEWGVAQGCSLYDLEGINPRGNPGVYEFKRKMGGEEIFMPGKEYLPFTTLGSVIGWYDRKFR
jgi:lipid II:glycine glycyltransferase (peptidoglycan interpeptide bridge formation enzyme)